jgi:hypothetical protein
MEWLSKLVGRRASQPDTPSFSQADVRQAFLTRAGNRFFNDLDRPTQTRVSKVFARQDVEGLRQLVDTYDATTVEGIALALDDAVEAVIGEESSYHSWTTDIIQGQENKL